LHDERAFEHIDEYVGVMAVRQRCASRQIFDGKDRDLFAGNAARQ
jgi:hypothetical protein